MGNNIRRNPKGPGMSDTERGILLRIIGDHGEAAPIIFALLKTFNPACRRIIVRQIVRQQITGKRLESFFLECNGSVLKMGQKLIRAERGLMHRPLYGADLS